MVQGFRMRKLVEEKNTIFLESKANVETFPKPSAYIRVFYKMVLKAVKSLNWI